MTGSNYIKIYTGSFIIVQKMIDALENIGINAVIKDETESGRLAGFSASIPGQQEVFVNKDELDNAIPIVEEIISKLKE